MSMEIFYFTGTGNSLAVARGLADHMKAKLTPVVGTLGLESYDTAADSIGLIFPVYDFKAPEIIEDFIKKINDIGAKYVFAVCTYGVAPLNAMKKFKVSLHKLGGNLAGGFAVKMPHNGIGSGVYSQYDDQILIKNCNTKIKIIYEYVMSKKEGVLEKSNAFESFILSGLLIKMIPTLVKLFKQVVFKGWKSLAFRANDKCNGCGICSEVCPLNNIEIIEMKPSWGDSCTGCMACLHWCPNEAIQMSETNMNIRKYHHPDIRIADIIEPRLADAGS